MLPYGQGAIRTTPLLAATGVGRKSQGITFTGSLQKQPGVLLLRRSQASAPLLDAVKDKKTRDAVRSVIERFTGGGFKLPTPDAQAAPASVPAEAGK